MPSWVAEEHC